jgi:hypothetical protein
MVFKREDEIAKGNRLDGMFLRSFAIWYADWKFKQKYVINLGFSASGIYHSFTG